MYLIEVLAHVYILCQGNEAIQFSLPHSEAELRPGLVPVLCVCVFLSSTPSSTSSQVCVCAGKLVAYLFQREYILKTHRGFNVKHDNTFLNILIGMSSSESPISMLILMCLNIDVDKRVYNRSTTIKIKMTS
jgi:hypothetical protein